MNPKLEREAKKLFDITDRFNNWEDLFPIEQEGWLRLARHVRRRIAKAEKRPVFVTPKSIYSKP